MQTYDVLIVGGGPAGSSCAWKLRHSGLKIAILDKQTFPRDKVCGGWITPSVLADLEIDPLDYGCGRVLQPIARFRTGYIGGAAIETDYCEPVSYGIRRREFDDYLVKRCGATLLEAAALESMERSGDRWIVNSKIEARLVVGAGGHFCPVAKFMGAQTSREAAVVAQEIEFEMSAAERDGCSVHEQGPELYFCSDMKGYGWCFRKANVLNIGLGRADPAHLSRHVSGFVQFLRSQRRISFDIPAPRGHAYLLYGTSKRDPVGDGVLLIGDAAGLAYAQSGEGIRPAIESGLLAAETIARAQGNYDRANLEPYRAALAERLGRPREWTMAAGQYLPTPWIGALARQLLRTRWFTRSVVLNRWFLHKGEPALTDLSDARVIPARARA
jgi:geranylgeranyl reductase family protein